tara:strand:+ start:3109 stop:3351 length:243 start_codon:yes stop_codon:yes gene_type:complete
VVKKLFSTLLLIGLLLPTITEAGVSPEGRNKRRKPRCKGSGGVMVCRMPKHRKPKRCGIMPCIPPGYYRPNPPRVIPMGF